MSRSLFQNSKAALAFAAVTLVGAVSMIGTSDDRGMLPALMDRFGGGAAQAQPQAEPSPEAVPPPPPPPPPSVPSAQVPGFWDAPQPVFGTYQPSTGGADPDHSGEAANPYQPGPPQPVGAPAPAARPAAGPMNAPLAPGATVVN